MKALILLATHVGAVGFGVALGIYLLPILIEPEGPAAEVIEQAATGATYTATFTRDLQDSDALHWGEGEVFVGPEVIALRGELAPGPDYRLYLSPEFVETEADFVAKKAQMVQVGMINTFTNFMVDVPSAIDPGNYRAVIVWCESFGQFITAAEYR